MDINFSPSPAKCNIITTGQGGKGRKVETGGTRKGKKREDYEERKEQRETGERKTVEEKPRVKEPEREKEEN